MPGPAPQTLVLEYPDGSRVEMPFAQLPLSLRAEVLKQPAACRPSLDPPAEKHVVVEWGDGWKEVVQVDPSCTGLRRYYVISRTEEVGRLSLDTSEGYPQLLEIGRRPLGVRRIVFGGAYAATLRSSEREGKKTDHWFSLEPDDRAVDDLRTAVLAAAEAEGVSLLDLRGAGATAELRERSLAVAARVGLVAGSRQQDLYDFLASVVGEEGGS